MKTSSSQHASSAVDYETGDPPRLMAFSAATEIRPLSDEEMAQVAGAIKSNNTGCTGTNQERSLCTEWDI